MEYSIIKTVMTNVVFVPGDPKNYKAVHHQILAGGNSLKDAQAEAMRAALHSAEAALPDRPTAVAITWRTNMQLDLQLAWDGGADLQTVQETYVVYPSRQVPGEEVRK